jgi:hypothetical protein
MILERGSLSALQQDLLHTLLNRGVMRRARGGYVVAPGSKPYNKRTVLMLERAGLLTLGQDGSTIAITSDGSRLMVDGRVELQEQMAG